MQAVFHIKKHKNAVRKISLPFLSLSDLMMFSTARRIGTSPVNNSSEVNGVGGHASHNKNELLRANK
jgi:hypothetical protein